MHLKLKVVSFRFFFVRSIRCAFVINIFSLIFLSGSFKSASLPRMSESRNLVLASTAKAFDEIFMVTKC